MNMQSVPGLPLPHIEGLGTRLVSVLRTAFRESDDHYLKYINLGFAFILIIDVLHASLLTKLSLFSFLV